MPNSSRLIATGLNARVAMIHVGTIGNAARSNIRGPGMNNFDISLQKNIPVGDRVKLQFRSEFYNAFNHTQFSAIDTAARFDGRGSQVNARLGDSSQV